MTSESEENAPEFRDYLEKHANDKWPRNLARLYSNYTRLDAGQPGLRSWIPDETRLRLNDAFRLVVAASAISDTESSLSSKGYRRAGEILEWLIPAVPDDIRSKVLTLAAGSYQIAGYPARASALLANAQPSVLHSLLAADFDSLMVELSRYWSYDPDDDEIPEDEIDYTHLIRVESSRVFGALAAYVRWGTGQSELGLLHDKANALRHLLQYSDRPLDGLEAALSFDAMNKFTELLLRRQLDTFKSALSEEGKEATERYCRLLYKSKKSVAWPIQIEGIDRILSVGSFAVFAPTGSGKTAVAELAILHALFSEDCPSDAIILYITPSRALAREVERKLTDTLGTACSISVTTLYGGAEWNPDNVMMGSDLGVIICTYEKAEALNRHLGRAWRNRIKLVIVDEGHSVVLGDNNKNLTSGNSRPLRLESLISRFSSQLRQSGRLILLSAVAEGAKVQLQSWVAGSNNERFIDVAQRSMRQVVGNLELEESGDSVVNYDVLDGNLLSISEDGRRPFVEDLVPRCIIPDSWSEKGRKKKARLFWAAINLARMENGRAESVLISLVRQISAYANAFAEFLEDEYWSSQLPEFAPDVSSRSVLWKQCLVVCADYFGTSSAEYRLLRRGVVVHHGKMPGKLAGLLAELIASGEVRVVLATSTLSEGVNLPFRTVLIPELARYSDDVRIPMDVREFANLVGRAGRPGQAAEGRALVVMTSAEKNGSGWIASDYHTLMGKYLNTAQIEPASPLLQLMRLLRSLWENEFGDGTMTFEDWLEITAPHAADENIGNAEETLSVLDGILLSILVETETEQHDGIELEEILSRVWKDTLAGVISGVSAESESFIRRGESLLKLVPDIDTRHKIYASGIRPTSSLQLIDLQNEILEHLRLGSTYAEMDKEERVNWIIDIARVLSAIEEFKIRPLRKNSKTKWEDILRWWMAKDAASIKPEAKSVAKWIGFVSSRFVYGTSWGLGCLLSMASANLTADSSSVEAALASLDLPWVSVWIPLMLKWGTSSPAAAWLLETSRADTRDDAESHAAEFELSVKSLGLDLDPYNFDLIKAWAEQRDENIEKTTRNKGLVSKDIEPIDGLPKCQKYHVIPVFKENHVVWADPAGYVLAVSDIPNGWQQNESIAERDYYLDTGKEWIEWKNYI